MKGKVLFSAVLFTCLGLLSCGLQSIPVGKTEPEAKVVKEPISIEKESWEVSWEKTLQNARKEGKVLVYGTQSIPALKEVSPAFTKKYGITLEVIPFSRGAEMTAKILAERKAGIFLLDIIIGGMNTFSGDINPQGIVESFEPMLILPDVLDGKNWYGGELHWGDKDCRALNIFAYPNNSLAINTQLVKSDEMKSYYDILNPKWKGKILMNDPTIAGTGLKSFSVLAFHILNLDFFRQLAKQEPMIIRDQRLQVDWLAKGKYSILVFPSNTPMTEYLEVGAPVAYALTKEGTYLSTDAGAINLVNRAPHPNAAKVLLNWIPSREGLSLIYKARGVQSARVDVPTEGIDPQLVRKPGVSYFVGADSEEWLSRDPEFKKAAEEIFGYLIK